jgi:hypothetical protein
MQSVHLVPIALLLIRSDVPLFLQLFQVVVDVLFELSHALCRKGMRHRLPLPRMFRAVPCVEQSPTNAHKRIVVLALEEAVSVAIYLRDSVRIRNTNVVWLDAHELAVFGVGGVNSEEAFPLTTLCEEPEVCECGREGRGYGADLPIADVG